MLNHPVSYVMGSKGIRLLVHVPVARPPVRRMELYKMRSAHLEVHGSLTVRFRTEYNFIAVDHRDGGHVALNSAELETCNSARGAKLRFCPAHNLVLHAPDSCIAALYHENMGLINKFCDKTIVKADDTRVFELKPHQFLVRPGGSVVHKSCKGHSVRVPLDYPAVITVRKGCTLASADFTASGGEESFGTVVKATLTFKPSELGVPHSDVDKLVAALDLPHVTEIKPLPPRPWGQWFIGSDWFLPTLAFVILIPIMIVIICRFKCRRTKPVAAAQPVSQMIPMQPIIMAPQVMPHVSGYASASGHSDSDRSFAGERSFVTFEDDEDTNVNEVARGKRSPPPRKRKESTLSLSRPFRRLLALDP